MPNVTAAEWQLRGIAGMEEQAWRAVRSQHHVLVVAGPGAGKTELLAQRASYLFETGICPSPQRILAISFKRDAAFNLRERVRIRCGAEFVKRFDSYTFAGWSKGLVDRFRLALPAELRPTANYQIDYSLRAEQPLREQLDRCCTTAGFARERLHNVSPERLQSFFQQYVLGHALGEYHGLETGRDLYNLAKVFWSFVLHRGVASRLEFTMIAALARLLLQTNPLLSAALQGTYGYVFLDEFQDTTDGQYQLVQTAFHSSTALMTAVGDPKQRIMGWADASATILTDFIRDFSAERIRLVLNYRSAPYLIAIQQRLIAALDPESPQILAGEAWPPEAGECRVLSFDDDHAEAIYTARLIADWIANDQVSPDQFCIIVRKQASAYTRPLQRALSALSIPSQLQDSVLDLVTEPVIQVIIEGIKWCVSPQAPASWRKLLALFLSSRGIEDMHAPVAKVKSLSDELSSFLYHWRPNIIQAADTYAVEQLMKEFTAFIGDAYFSTAYIQYKQPTFLRHTIRDGARTLAEARNRAPDWQTAINSITGVGAIPIMSIHKSKGLEYHAVIFIGLEDEPFLGIGSGATEEESNFFVAFSRAKYRVVFTHSRTRYKGGSIGFAQSRTAVGGIYDLLYEAGVSVEHL